MPTTEGSTAKDPADPEGRPAVIALVDAGIAGLGASRSRQFDARDSATETAGSPRRRRRVVAETVERCVKDAALDVGTTDDRFETGTVGRCVRRLRLTYGGKRESHYYRRHRGSRLSRNRQKTLLAQHPELRRSRPYPT